MKFKARIQTVSAVEFRRLLNAKLIRGASLEDVYGTHHRRKLYRHPVTNAFFVEVK